MKQSEIVKGHIYSNGKGRERVVIDIGPQYTLYDGQESKHNLRYEIVRDGTKGNFTAEQRSNMTVKSFASWAKEDITSKQEAEGLV